MSGLFQSCQYTVVGALIEVYTLSKTWRGAEGIRHNGEGFSR